VSRPSLILADEPTGALDTTTSHEIMETFRDLNERLGLTVILVTHEREVADYARRIIRLRDGEVVLDEPNHHRPAVGVRS
jgi:ABC-type lipoprotein export system ATPase subunit